VGIILLGMPVSFRLSETIQISWLLATANSSLECPKWCWLTRPETGEVARWMLGVCGCDWEGPGVVSPVETA
jgi:hypothetical protein